MKLRLSFVVDQNYNIRFSPYNASGINLYKFIKSYKKKATAIGYEHKIIFELPDDLPISHSYASYGSHSYEAAVKRYIKTVIRNDVRKETIKIIILKKAYKPELNN